MTGNVVEPFIRPNGKIYRPRSYILRSARWENDGTDDQIGVIVLRTLSVDRAYPFAYQMVRYWFGYDAVLADNPEPKVGWWRDGYSYGQRRWVYDENRGMPGVMFWVVEA